jgi:hypothetical protein
MLVPRGRIYQAFTVLDGAIVRIVGRLADLWPTGRS